MPIAKDIIDRILGTKQGEAGYQVVEMLMDAGYECYWIGGAVRDMMLSHMPKEIDMATSAKPHEVEKIFKKSDLSAADLGTTIVSHKGFTFELTTFREDDDRGDGRRPEKVVFGSKEKDVLRRDATINAMYWNPVSQELYDPCHGEKDIKEKLVRFIGDPTLRIKQDALRILRLVRLRATIDGQYDLKTYKALGESAELTKILSGTRVLQELEKILQCPHPAKALEDLWETGVLKQVLPELHVCKGVAQPKEYHYEGDVWNHLLQCTSKYLDDHGRDVRIAALMHDIGKPETFAVKERIRFDEHAQVSAKIAETILKRLQMPAQRVKKISWLISHHMMMGAFEKLSPERKAHWYFHPWFQELLQLFWLDIAGTTPSNFDLYDQIIEDYDAFLNDNPRPQKPLLTGDEVMEILDLEPGEKVGEILKALQDAQVKKEITKKAEAKKFIERFK